MEVIFEVIELVIAKKFSGFRVDHFYKWFAKAQYLENCLRLVWKLGTHKL